MSWSQVGLVTSDRTPCGGCETPAMRWSCWIIWTVDTNRLFNIDIERCPQCGGKK